MGDDVVVIGGGIMGAGIAFVAHAAGLDVTVVEAGADAVLAARARIDDHVAKARAHGDDLAGAGTLGYTTSIAEAVGHAAIVVEAVSEQLELKRTVFATIGAHAHEGAVLASNTSGLSLEVLGAASGRPARVVGTHFFNPVPAMRLVELVRAPETSDETVRRALAFCGTLGKEAVEVRDLPGFVTTRLGTLLMCEAIRAYEQRVASVADIDTAMRLGYNHPVGPLALADRVGLDTLLAILDDLRVAFGDAFLAPPLLRQMVAAGKLGRKSGRGFYDYTSEPA